MGKWVNYQKLRDVLRFEAVLETYGVEVAYKGDQATAFCPLPGHEDKKSKSFSANLERGIFQCFGCHAKGNILEFCVRMEGFDPDDGKEFRQGALKVQERFAANGKVSGAKRDELDEPKEKSKVKKRKSKPEVETPSDSPQEEKLERAINAPLEFELKSVDASHPYLKDRGLTPATIEYFGLGYCARGMMKGRVVIPLHDHEGRLIGYAGRLVDDTAIDDDQPKYLLPGKREAKGIRHEFWKSEFVFNGHRLTEPGPDVIVVEGFFQAIWLHQCGFPRVVAVMGSTISEKQVVLIKRYISDAGHVYLLPDGDDAGDKMAEAVLPRLAKGHWVRWLRLPGGNDADSVSEKSLHILLGDVGL